MVNNALVATFTDGSRTVTLIGPSRTFTEPGLSVSVKHNFWVRLAPYTWSAAAASGNWVHNWLDSARASTSADILSAAVQYIPGSPAVRDYNGVRYAGEAKYGPMQDGARQAGGDLNDYLGTTYRFADGSSKTGRSEFAGCIDCSGYVRLVFGKRFSYPLLRGTAAGPGLPRRSLDMENHAPGTMLIRNTGVRPATTGMLRPGDLVFFNTNGSGIINHVGILLGIDTNGRRRFISSRKTINGPTFGDVAGAGSIDGTGYYAQAFRSARRL